MDINQSSSNKHELRRFAPGKAKNERVKRVFLGGLLTAATVAGGLTFTSEVFATKPDPEHKIWICHVVEGNGEHKNGYNTIPIDEAAWNGGEQSDHRSHVSKNGRRDFEANETSDCGGIKPPLVENVWDEVECGDLTVYGVETTTTYEWDGRADDWAVDKVTEEKVSRPVGGEQQECLMEAVPVLPERMGPSCSAPGSVMLPPVSDGYEWLKRGKTYVAVADKGYFFGDDAVTEFDPGDLTQLAGDACPTTSPPADRPPVVVDALPPVVVPAAAPPAAATPVVATAGGVVAAAPTQLPSTGSSSWVTALIAMVTLLGGTGLVRLSRRPTD